MSVRAVRRLAQRRTRSDNGFELTDDTKEYYAWIDARRDAHPENCLVYDPQPQHRIAKSGAWVMIIRALPPIERGLDKEVKVGRFFYAERSSDNTDDEGFGVDGTYKVRLRTVWGEVCVWPYEYAKIETDRILAMWGAGELIFHPTDVSPAELNEEVFYARSRGIPLGQAVVMALGSIEANIGWFEPHADLVVDLEELSEYATHQMGRLTEVNHRRRAASKRRTKSLR